MDDIHLLITQYGLLLVFANVLIGQFGVPIPAFPTLMVAGGFARSGDLSLIAVFALAMLACVIAHGIRFEVGRRFGQRALRAICKASLAPDSCVRQSDMMFEKWGVGALVVAKFVPGLNIVGPALAGAVRFAGRASRSTTPSARRFGPAPASAAVWYSMGRSIGSLTRSRS